MVENSQRSRSRALIPCQICTMKWRQKMDHKNGCKKLRYITGQHNKQMKTLSPFKDKDAVIYR